MKRSLFLAAGAAAGLMLLAPAAALATTPTTTPATPTTTTPGDGPLITQPLRVNPDKARPGDRVGLTFHCVTSGDQKVVLTVKSVALDFDRTGAQRWTSAKVKDVKPGKYDVVLGCGAVTSTASIQVLPKAPVKKQVEKVPAGAPQTGGTDGPVDGGPDGVVMAAGAMGVLAAGGAGLVVLSRRRRVQ